jgi:hypothetical protein
LPISTPGVASACSPRNPAAETKASETRNSRASPPPRGDADRVAERDVDPRRGEHQPEVRRMVLPALVDGRVRQHQHEHGRADDQHEQRPEGVRGAAG